MAGFRRNCFRLQWAVPMALLGCIGTALIGGSAVRGEEPTADPLKGSAKTLDGVSQAVGGSPVIDPKAPDKDLFPAAPRSAPKPWSLKLEDLAQVPELAFWDLPKDPGAEKRV